MCDARETPERDIPFAGPGPALTELDIVGCTGELRGGDRLQLRLHLLGSAQHGTRSEPTHEIAMQHGRVAVEDRPEPNRVVE